MDTNLKTRLDYEIIILERTKEEYNARLYQLRDCKDSFLRWTDHGNHKYYYIKSRGSKTYKYTRKSDFQDVQRIKEVRFLEEAIRRIDRDIDLVKCLSNGFLPFDPSAVNESLPEVYRCSVPPVSELYKVESDKWLSKRLEDQKLFPENYPERKKHTASDGVKVKTVSELVLYERLKDAGLALIYELPLPLKDYGPPVYPDVTVLSPIDMKTEIIVEYVGLLDLYEYRVDFVKKLGRYIKKGYIPGVNLFFIFSDANGNVDSIQITKVIADIFGIRAR